MTDANSAYYLCTKLQNLQIYIVFIVVFYYFILIPKADVNLDRVIMLASLSSWTLEQR